MEYQELWEVKRNSSGVIIAVGPVKIREYVGASWLDVSEEDARRIVACVNACAGIPTSRLEAGAADILAFSMELHKQRDELLAALKDLRSKLNSHAQATAFYGDQPEFELECLAVVEPAIAAVEKVNE